MVKASLSIFIKWAGKSVLGLVALIVALCLVVGLFMDNDLYTFLGVLFVILGLGSAIFMTFIINSRRRYS